MEDQESESVLEASSVARDIRLIVGGLIVLALVGGFYLLRELTEPEVAPGGSTQSLELQK